MAGPRGNKQRALGRFIIDDAGDCQRDIQLVRQPEPLYDYIRSDASHSQLLNEIMPMTYKRFTEKSAEEWRQIYKVSRLETVVKVTNKA